MLANAETVQLETKRVSGKMVGKALETVCAFANTHGGWLVLGVEDAGKAQGLQRLFGVAENPEAVDELLRKLGTHLLPAVEGVQAFRMPSVLRDGAEGALILLHVPTSDKVHSILDGGTWMRGQSSNREMTSTQITDLSYRRGVRSAESEPVDVDFELLDTPAWRLYLRGRNLAPTGIADQLYRVGLARKVGGEMQPLRAAVLLFADHPSGLLATLGTRADVRVFHYHGNAISAGEVPNLKKQPRTLSGPLYHLIAQTHAYLLDELAGGLTLAASGFRTIHRYPERVIKEAVTNAIIHRDYRMNRDVQIRIFDSRIEVLSPGLFPGRISAATVHRTGSFARNPLVASNLREFPEPPNVDAGEGVQMMFNLMKISGLYPPQYRELREQAQEAISVTLLNEERPPVWEQVSDWMDRHGPIANGDLCAIADLDTLKASKQLKRWVDQGLLVADPNRGKRNMVYRKPAANGDDDTFDLLSGAADNNVPDGKISRKNK
ncbi:MAG: putative DNA binding domain-containing protein [Gammaproteobacteria bacterium]|nr:putative DNA binding domain-containing protein [Gammaproteobacteria bacterium]MBU1440267.1 putative DNA binding domain-containing protein [Gammaproteobacteria bacterium]MBU2287269.1 putative DNA binding domain-containing protein [Gammaproteobacteria bacterium]MBU2411064.1 putative DNA binding domain-containing protein [Gammaproteobacteria bacterium]